MAASIMKKFSFKRDHIISKPTDNNFSQPDGPFTENTSGREREDKHIMRLLPDKELETKVLQSRFEYLSSNLPPDDVAIEMNSKGLLTVKEHEEYLSMKRVHTSDSIKSEYLLQCLGRRKAGFLTRFCEILREIEQASYLADDITEAYKRVTIQKGSKLLSSYHRNSNLSLSDPDLRIKEVHLPAQECTKCKVLERQNRKLEQQIRQLKEQQDFNQTTFLPFRPLAEVAHEQLQRALTEMNKLVKQVPLMQEAITQTSGGITAAQVSLKKMKDVLDQGSKTRIMVTAVPRMHSVSLRSSVVSGASLYVSEDGLEKDKENQSQL